MDKQVNSNSSATANTKLVDQKTKAELSPEVKEFDGKSVNKVEEFEKLEESRKIMNEKSKFTNNFEQMVYLEKEEHKHIDDDEQNLQILIQNLDNNCELNSIITILNRFLTKHAKKTLDKEHLVIHLNLDDLDKFEEKKKMQPTFQVSITFSLDSKSWFTK